MWGVAGAAHQRGTHGAVRLVSGIVCRAIHFDCNSLLRKRNVDCRIKQVRAETGQWWDRHSRAGGASRRASQAGMLGTPAASSAGDSSCGRAHDARCRRWLAHRTGRPRWPPPPAVAPGQLQWWRQRPPAPPTPLCSGGCRPRAPRLRPLPQTARACLLSAAVPPSSRAPPAGAPSRTGAAAAGAAAWLRPAARAP